MDRDRRARHFVARRLGHQGLLVPPGLVRHRHRHENGEEGDQAQTRRLLLGRQGWVEKRRVAGVRALVLVLES